MARIVIAGAGVGGLGTALYAGRSGHDVVLVERDDTPLPPTASEAFWWDRRGAPQVRHSHAFLARVRNQLRDDHPDVLARLLAEGATEMDFIAMLPEGMDQTPVDGDEDLVAIACRRTTFEWVLRKIVTEEGSATLRHGAGISGLLLDDTQSTPSVRGVALTDGSEIAADVVVLAGGRRMDVPKLYRGAVGTLGHVASSDAVTVAEDEEDTGIIYLSRFYRLHEGAEYPPQLGPIGGDLGFLKFGVFPGDDSTFSITLAVASGDKELRHMLLDPDAFSAAARLLPATSAHVDGRSEPITGVEVMGGLINRKRDFLTGGEPVLLGVHSVGDAHTCTNPLYGRGCSLAMVQAALFSKALDTHGSDARARSIEYELESIQEVLPWHSAAVTQDRMSRDAVASAAQPATDQADEPPETTQASFMRNVLREGLFPAMRVDPLVLRAFLRMFNLLTPPDSLMADPHVTARVMEVYQDRNDRPAEPPLGPDRQELVATLHKIAGQPPQS